MFRKRTLTIAALGLVLVISGLSCRSSNRSEEIQVQGKVQLERNKAIVRRVWDEMVNQKRLELADFLYHPDYVEHTSSGTSEMTGPEVPKASCLWMQEVFPDAHFTIEDLIAEGDRVVCRITVTGTHQGDYRGFAGTGKKVTFWAVVVHRLAEGKIIEEWCLVDSFGFMDQIGGNRDQ